MYEKTTLENGLRVVTASMPHTRAVTVMLLIGAGSRYEDERESGVSHFLEHMLFKGTERRPTPREISETIEGVGGVLNASTDREATTFWCKAPQPHFSTALDLLVDMLRSSLFQPPEVERERAVVLEELAMSHDYPSDRVGILLDELLWPDQPLGRDVGGTRESVSALSREAMLGYMDRLYVPSNVVVSVAGGVSHDQVVEEVARSLGGWRGPGPSPWNPERTDGASPRLGLERRPTEQAHLCLGLRGLSSVHPDRYALDLLSIVLGEGMSSRLFVALREEQGLAYDIGSGVHHLLDTGAFSVSAGVDPANAERTVSAVLKELAAVKEGVPPQELHKAIEVGRGRLLLRLEDSRSVAGFLGFQELLQGDILTADQVVDRISAVTPDDLRRVAQDLFREDRMCLAVVGPVEDDAGLREMLALR